LNRNRLRAAIAMKGLTMGAFLERAKIAPASFSRKMREENAVEFTRAEIERIKDLLELSNEEMCEIFFDEKVS